MEGRECGNKKGIPWKGRRHGREGIIRELHGREGDMEGDIKGQET